LFFSRILSNKINKPTPHYQIFDALSEFGVEIEKNVNFGAFFKKSKNRFFSKKLPQHKNFQELQLFCCI
jgi:hypothetical protein